MAHSPTISTPSPRAGAYCWRDRFPVTHSGTPDATTLVARDPGAGDLGAPLPRTPSEPLPHTRCREQCRLHWCPATRGCLPIAPPPSSDRFPHYCMHRLRTLPAAPHPIASSSPPTGADLAPCRPDPRLLGLLAALMRQHGYCSEPGHGRTALLASSGKDCSTTLELSPRPEHRPPRASRTENGSRHSVLSAGCSIVVGGSTASLLRAPGRRPLT